jgi:hypothetical protein
VRVCVCVCCKLGKNFTETFQLKHMLGALGWRAIKKVWSLFEYSMHLNEEDIFTANPHSEVTFKSLCSILTLYSLQTPDIPLLHIMTTINQMPLILVHVIIQTASSRNS